MAPFFVLKFMRPKRTFFRAERVRVVPPKGKARRRRRRRPCPPQAPPEALPAAGVRRRVCFGGRARDSIWQLPGPRWGRAHSADPRAAELARPGPGGTQPSLLAPTRGGWEGPLCGTGTQRGEQAQWQGREFDTSHVNWPAQCPSCCYVASVLVTMAAACLADLAFAFASASLLC